MNKNQENILLNQTRLILNENSSLKKKSDQVSKTIEISYNEEIVLKNEVDLENNGDGSDIRIKVEESSDENVNIKHQKCNNSINILSNINKRNSDIIVYSSEAVPKNKINLENNCDGSDISIINYKNQKSNKRLLPNTNKRKNDITVVKARIVKLYNDKEHSEIEQKKLKLDNTGPKQNILRNKISDSFKSNSEDKYSSINKQNSCVFTNSKEKEERNKVIIEQELINVDSNTKMDSILSDFSKSNSKDKYSSVNKKTNSISINSKKKEEKNKIQIDQQLRKEDSKTKMNSVLCQTIKYPLLSIDHIKDNNRAIEFFTGLQNFQKFCYAFTLLGHDAYDLNYYYQIHDIRLSILDQFFMTLVILKLHKSHYEISILFNISLRDIKNIFITWIRFMQLEWSRLKLPRDYQPKQQRINYNSGQSHKDNSSRDCHVDEDVEFIGEVETEKGIDNFKKVYKILNGPQNYIEGHLMRDIIFVCHVLCYFRVKRMSLLEPILPKF